MANMRLVGSPTQVFRHFVDKHRNTHGLVVLVQPAPTAGASWMYSTGREAEALTTGNTPGRQTPLFHRNQTESLKTGAIQIVHGNKPEL